MLIQKAFYYAKKLPGYTSLGSMFLIYNNSDTREISESELITLINNNKVELINYHINPNDPTKLTMLHTNLNIPEERNFQYSILHGITEENWTGKMVVLNHLYKIKDILKQSESDENNKFIERLLKVVSLYISYMHDSNAVIEGIIEKKAIKITTNLNSTELNTIKELSLTASMNDKYADFCKHSNRLDSYYYIVDISIRLIRTTSKMYIANLASILAKVINLSHYTFVGEQMDKYFCLDLVNKYKAAIFDSQTVVINKLTPAEHKQKVDECVRFFVNKYNDFENKIRTNKHNIINSINNSNDALELKRCLDKLDSRSLGDIPGTLNAGVTDEYIKFINDSAAHVVALLKIFKDNYFTDNNGSMKSCNIMRTFATAMETSGGALMSGGNPGVSAAGAVLSTGGFCVKTMTDGTETTKLCDELSDKVLNKYIPKDIIPVLKELQTLNSFYYCCLLYMFEVSLYESILSRHNYKKMYNYGAKDYYKDIETFKDKRDKYFKKFSRHMNLQLYIDSYVRILSDMLTCDELCLKSKVYNFNINVFDKSDELHTMIIPWLSACRIMSLNINYNKVYGIEFENRLFWKLVEDTFHSIKVYRHESDRNKILEKYRDALNFIFCIHLLESKDFNVDILDLVNRDVE